MGSLTKSEALKILEFTYEFFSPLETKRVGDMVIFNGPSLAECEVRAGYLKENLPHLINELWVMNKRLNGGKIDEDP